MEALLELPPEFRRAAIRRLPRAVRRRLPFVWEIWGRPDQVWRPSDHTYTVYLAGRGWGKTRVGAEAVRYVAERPWLAGGRRPRGRGDTRCGEGAIIGIAGRTANDVNQTMLYGPSGLITKSPAWFRPHHNKSDKTLIWPNGAMARLMSGDVPASFRGPNFGFFWGDELPHWARAADSWAMAKLSLRHGEHARAVLTTTPLGTEEIVRLVYQTGEDGSPIPDADAIDGFAENPNTRIVRGSTYDNVANLAASFVEEIVGDYEGTDLGEQELHGRIILDVPGALWSSGWFRRCSFPELPDLRHVVLAIDPAVKQGSGGRKAEKPETGMVVLGLGVDDRIYLLADATGDYSPKGWATVAHKLCAEYGVDTITEEDNNGGELVSANLETYGMPRGVRIVPVTAHRSKERRARMVNGLWEKGQVVHVGDSRRWRALEWQLTHWSPQAGGLADRMDAVVWGAIHILGGGGDLAKLRALGNRDVWSQVADRLADPERRRGPSREPRRRGPSRDRGEMD